MSFEEKRNKAYLDLSEPDYSAKDQDMFHKGADWAKKELGWHSIEAAPRDGTRRTQITESPINHLSKVFMITSPF